MSRFSAVAAGLLLLLTSSAAAGAQEAAVGVQVAPLAAPDAFSTPARSTSLPPTLWQGASADTIARVLPLLAGKPLSPAAAALARRVLATGAVGPQGVGADPVLTAARAQALLALGDAKGAAAVLARAPGLDRSAELSRAAAESALLAGDDARACAIEEALGVGREEVYWLRLRAYCQVVAGQAAQAQLTFDLAQAQAKDPVFARLMGAKIAGAGNPGAASLRNGLDYALSRSLGLDAGAAKAAPAVASALAAGDPSEPTFASPAAADEASTAAAALIAGQPLGPETLPRLLDAAAKTDAKGRARAEGAALLLVALADDDGPDVRGRISAFAATEGKAPLGRDLAMDEAARQKLMGETAILALWTCAEAGANGPVLADRVRIVRALRQAGLAADARNFAVEGLLALK